MQAAGEFVMEVQGLRRVFGDTVAVDSVDLAVRRGEMFGLVGPDGAGKSTTIRLLCGLLQPTGGSGRILGFDLARDLDRIKARIGYLSQNFTLYGDLTVDENIEFFAEIHEVTRFRERRNELLEATQLLPFRGRLAQVLSGGMKKKLALACTLIHQPDLVLLDEPSTGVDPVSRGELWAILGTMLEQGITVFLTTPYLDEAERCDRVGLMHQGKIVIVGTPAVVRARMPGQVFRLECARPEQAYRILRQRWPSTHVVLFGGRVRFWTEQGQDEVDSALALLAGQGLGEVAARVDAPTLEDAFVGLVGAGTKNEG